MANRGRVRILAANGYVVIWVLLAVVVVGLLLAWFVFHPFGFGTKRPPDPPTP
jgi:hypothetical protein